MKTAEKMFKELGFKKNKSVCYNDQHILYEKAVMSGTDFLEIEFKDGYYVYRNSWNRALKTYKDIHVAIHQQLKELRWLGE